jgi:hypothetical protein
VLATLAATLAAVALVLGGCGSDASVRQAGAADASDANNANSQKVLVAMGDSYMSGEGGRRASNGYTVSESEGTPTRKAGDYGDVAVGDFGVYDQAQAGGPRTDWCHRTTSSPGNIGDGWTVINLACSGALTSSELITLSDGKTKAWKPGIDYGLNPATGDRGQARMLQDIAAKSDVERILLSIGGNNLQFSDLIKWCVKASAGSAGPCKYQERVQELTNEANRARVSQSINDALYNIQRAMFTAKLANRTKPWTLVYQMPPLPLPLGKDNISDSRLARTYLGCSFYDEDLEYFANTVGPSVRNTMVEAVRQFYDSGAKKGNWNIRVEDSSGVFAQHRLCDKATDRTTTSVRPGVQSNPDWTKVGQKSEWVTDISIWDSLTTANLHLLTEPMHPNYWGQRVLAACARAMFAASDSFNQHVATCANDSPTDAIDSATSLPKVTVALTDDRAFVQREGVDAVPLSQVFALDRHGIEYLQFRTPGGQVSTFRVIGTEITQDYPGEQSSATKRKLRGSMSLLGFGGQSATAEFAMMGGQAPPFALGRYGERAYGADTMMTFWLTRPGETAKPAMMSADELLALATDDAARNSNPSICAGRGNYVAKGDALRFAYVDGKDGCEAQAW